MKYLFIYLLILINLPQLIAQTNMNGYVSDKKNREILVGANIHILSQNISLTTNEYGFYAITLPIGAYKMIVTYMGYKPDTIQFEMNNKSKQINIGLTPNNVEMNEVVVKYKIENQVNNLNIFHNQNLNQRKLATLPMTFGEPDIIKAIQLMPGVKNVADGSSGMYIRGGGLDQNLILIDEAPIYNPSHLFGLVSVFNPDIINNVSLYKGIIPANFGGRLSSVINTQLNEGSLLKTDCNIGISTLASRFTIQGPIKKEVASFHISARSSLGSFFFKPNENFTFVPSFYDINAKFNTKINNNNRIYFSIYHGRDRLLSYDGLSNYWGNSAATLRYNLSAGSKWFTNFCFIYSNYSNKYVFADKLRDYKWLTSIVDYTGKIQTSYYLNNNIKLYTGINMTYHHFTPGSNSTKTSIIPESNNLESAIYVNSEFIIRKNFSFQLGLRYSLFQSLGSNYWNDYTSMTDSVILQHNKSGVYNTYSGFEPRLNIVYQLNPKISIQFGYAKYYQYYQLIQNQSLSYTSIECWLPANKSLKPQFADVLTFAISSILKATKLNLEVYYKKLNNQIDYIDHAQLLNNPYIEKELRIGKGEAYGIEFSFKKEFWRIESEISYNWSRSIRKIRGINNNLWYPATYDIPHDLKLTASYNTNKRWIFSCIWMLMSGKAITIPTGYIQHNDRYVPIYSKRNSERLPFYHRLDLSAKLLSNKIGKSKSVWTFGIFNCYAKQNPLGYQFTFDPLNPPVKIYRYNFIRIFPNISYSINF